MLIASDGVTTPSGGSPDDSFWQRPSVPPAPASDGVIPPSVSEQPSTPIGPAYSGPPPNTPPPAGWRAPVHRQPLPPRPLPPQDEARLDQEEQGARTVTYGVGLIAAAIALVLVCLLCGRALF